MDDEHIDITINCKELADGRLAKVEPFMFTTAILVGVTNNEYHYYDTRYCYETAVEAVNALVAWDGVGDPPGKWIVQKPEGRYNKDVVGCG